MKDKYQNKERTLKRALNALYYQHAAVRALFVFIGTTRFELATSATPMQHSTKLSYVPMIPIIVCFFPAPVK